MPVITVPEDPNSIVHIPEFRNPELESSYTTHTRNTLGLVGTCRDIDHLRVFRSLPVVRFRFGTKGAKDATSRMRAVTLSDPCSAHVLLRGDVKDARLLEVLPVLTLPQPRAVRSLALGVTLRDGEEGRGDKHALCVLLLGLFPNLVALDVWGPPTLPTEVDYDRAMSETAPTTAGQRDFPVYGSLRTLRWDLAETNSRPMLHLLAGFRCLRRCTLGGTATHWLARRSKIVRSIIDTASPHLAVLEVEGPVAGTLPFVANLALRVNTTWDHLPTADPATRLAIEAREGRRSDLDAMVRRHPCFCAYIHRCTDLSAVSGCRRRGKGVGVYELRRECA